MVKLLLSFMLWIPGKVNFSTECIHDERTERDYLLT